jgi:hypothetical protein
LLDGEQGNPAQAAQRHQFNAIRKRSRNMARMPGCRWVAVLLLAALGNPAYAAVDERSANELLAAHNKYRSHLSLPPLRWSGSLADAAQRWADRLASIGRLEHSGPGENLAMGTARAYSLTQLVDLWGHEGRYFTNGIFPAVSTTGNWLDVGHFSQIVWRRTTMVGCGMARGRGQDVLVCSYSPPGNVMGEKPY